MKKIFYTGILLGSILLAGCSPNEKTEVQGPAKEEKMKEVANDQEVHVLPISDTDKEVVSNTPLELTQNQKAAYYKRYATIIEDINLEVPDADLELVPFEEFKSDEWVTLDNFRQIAMDMATTEWKMVR